jgi:hypothetical protein
MRIGIVPGLNSSLGGVYQYSITMLDGTGRDDMELFGGGAGHLTTFYVLATSMYALR